MSLLKREDNTKGCKEMHSGNRLLTVYFVSSDWTRLSRAAFKDLA
jgi:hypothetical protein